MQKLTIDQQAIILNRHINGMSPPAIAQEFGVTKTVIARILDSVDCKDLDDITKTNDQKREADQHLTKTLDPNVVQMTFGDWW